MEIKTFEFSDAGRNVLGQLEKGRDWPVVYLLDNGKVLYIGETTSAYTRFGQHLTSERNKHITTANIVFDDTYNKSVILDFEQRLIKYCKADGKYKKLLNRNAGQSSQHDYYQRESYFSTFKELWSELFRMGMVQNSIDVIESKSIFKYSPYSALTEEQNVVSIAILRDIFTNLSANQFGVSLVQGCAGTGKTVLAISMIYALVNACHIDEEKIADDELGLEKQAILKQIKEFVAQNGELKIGFVFPMSGIRKTISVVFSETGNGLSSSMVLSPYKLKDKEYDILFVDESHRLTRRKNLGAIFSKFDDVCQSMGLVTENASQLDWVLKKSKYCILFYDRDQSIKASDVTHQDYQATLQRYTANVNYYYLSTQMRCSGGSSYTSYVKDILNCRTNQYLEVNNYDFKLFDNVQEMVDTIKAKDNVFGLSKTVAGYSWKWETQPNSKPRDNYDYYNQLIRDGKYDIMIDGHKFIWNLTTEGWINRLDSHDTIGCIHTTQGFDLNYVGVIFGKEIDYNPQTNSIEIDLSHFYDRNVKAGCDEQTVKEYIINTYSTMLARGIKGCYVYACNPNMQNYLSQFIKK